MSDRDQGDVLRLAPESIEELALRLAEVVADVVADGAVPGPKSVDDDQQLTAAEVAEDWGVARRWVYDHAQELGVQPLGCGKRPRLRFDPEIVAERLGPRRRRSPSPRRRHLSPAAMRRRNSLSSGSRATVGRRHKKGPGAAPLTPPQPGAG